MDSGITIIGAGVIGLAISSELSGNGEKIFIVERNKKFGEETSSRHSEVIHSGIYYPEGSLKARFCVEGRDLLYKLCEEKDIPFRKCGKLVVATSKNEIPMLEEVKKKALSNGVNDMKYISEEELESIEPNVSALKALYFPSTGIIDSFSLMKYFEADALNNGVEFVYGVNVSGVKKIEGGYELSVVDADGEPFSFTTGVLINSAGLGSDLVAQSVGINNKEYSLHYWKGEYFSVGGGKGKYINRLVYPVPEPDNVGLGIHATIDLSGRLRLGPNAEYLPGKVIDYSVNPDNRKVFYDSVKNFLPFIELDDLGPDTAGIRPKLQKPGDSVKDFIICEESEKGFPGFINLLGIESPGLTACMSIAKYVRGFVEKIS